MFEHINFASSFTPFAPGYKEIRVLLLDDSMFDRARIRRLSGQTDLAIELDEVDSIGQLGKSVRARSYDLILIDFRLPVGDGMDALDLVMCDDRNRSAGKIMITGDESGISAASALERGCHGFVVKGEMNPTVLRQTMLAALTASRSDPPIKLNDVWVDDVDGSGEVPGLSDVVPMKDCPSAASATQGRRQAKAEGQLLYPEKSPRRYH